jgi:hypothetical protein
MEVLGKCLVITESGGYEEKWDPCGFREVEVINIHLPKNIQQLNPILHRQPRMPGYTRKKVKIEHIKRICGAL